MCKLIICYRHTLSVLIYLFKHEQNSLFKGKTLTLYFIITPQLSVFTENLVRKVQSKCRQELVTKILF